MAESDCGREMLMILRMSCNNLCYSTNCILNYYVMQLLRQIKFGGVYWKKLEPITNKILILTDCPPPRAAGKNPQSRFAGQQAGKNYFPLKPLSFLPACFGASWGNF